MSDPVEKKLDSRHMELRAAVFKLRKYAHALVGKKIAAKEFYDRLTWALYPKDDFRHEPLRQLLDEARADEAHDHRRMLLEVREAVLKLVEVRDRAATLAGMKEIAAQIDDFLTACDEPPPEKPDGA